MLAGEGDCDDTDAVVYPGAIEVCDDKDNDCDGLVDDHDPNIEGATAWYPDQDRDGYGADTVPATLCVAPQNYVADHTDCDDTDADIHPGATEVCDGADNDCDGEVDEDVSSTWYQDRDGDGWGDINSPLEACSQPDGYVALSGDFDDYDASRNPGAADVCNGVDDNGDGRIDEGSAEATDLGPAGACLVLYWPLDESESGRCTSGADACDLSGTGNDGTWINAGAGAGLIDGAISLNGSSAYVSRTDPIGWEGGDHSLTTAAWFYAESGFDRPNGRPVVAVGTTANRGHFYVRAFSDPDWGSWSPTCSGASYITLGADDGSADKWYCSTVTPALETWYHVAATYESSSLTVSLYVNGVLERTYVLSAPLDLDRPIYAGHDEHESEFFDGLIDDVRVYGRALSAEEVAALYGWTP